MVAVNPSVRGPRIFLRHWLKFKMEWTTDGCAHIKYRKYIGSGGSGQVHEVSYIFDDGN